jgi:hypothetical protein
LNAIAWLTGPPLSVTDPELGLAEYPTRDGIVKEEVPFGSVNTTVDVVELTRVPFSRADHDVPGNRPVSANVME